MQFGIPTLIELKSIQETAALCRELGFDFIEINMNLPQYQPNRLNINELCIVAQKYGIYYTIHLEEDLNPCDFNDKISAAYTETMLQTIGIAKVLNVPILNMHMNPGVRFTLPDKKVYLFDEYKSEYLRNLSEFRDKCAAAIGGFDIKITLENCGDYGRCGFLAEGLDVLLQRSAFALCFDIGHNAAADFADEPTVLERMNRLRHIHFHDAKGRLNHLPPGEGGLDLERYLGLAKTRECRVVAEVKTVAGLRSAADWLKNRGYFQHYS